MHCSLSCIGEGNGTPLLYSCLENPRDGGAWWAAIYGIAQSRTQLKRLSSIDSSPKKCCLSLLHGQVGSLPQAPPGKPLIHDMHDEMSAAAATSLQLWPTLRDPTGSSPPGSPIPGILQARTLEWVAISFSNAGK